MIYFVLRYKSQELQGGLPAYLLLQEWSATGEAMAIHELPAEEQLSALERYLSDPLYQMIRIDEKDEWAWERYVRVLPDGFGEETTLMINQWAEKRIEVIDRQAEQETLEIRTALEADPLPAYSVIQALRNHGEQINQEAAVQTGILRQWQQELKDWYEQNVRIKEETWIDILSKITYKYAYIRPTGILHVLDASRNPDGPDWAAKISTGDSASALIRQLLRADLEQQGISKGEENHHIQLFLYAENSSPVWWWKEHPEEALPEQLYIRYARPVLQP
ncbi:hypothetical protein [Paenibacillus bovis]|uniref:Uncharacterized protein n=1 Tax=Paenibacillus bovis TaxID=1616788 RepID=A0A1X9T4F4_9BACL|nr:hypothetical protein [Paenibacillus bovis]ARR10764.1 hypothetical protein AR543_p0156 [Paenibacillus bovis]